VSNDALIEEFTWQAQAFNASPAMHSHRSLAGLVELVPPNSNQRWLDAACGSGIVGRELCQRVGEVHGVDLTPAMIDLATQESNKAGIENMSFSIGDVCALPMADSSFDGAVTRFTIHHLPVPQRLIAELARVVRPGGLIVVQDHVTDTDPRAAAWHQEIERLRDPSHWACLTPAGLRTLCTSPNLVPEREQLVRFELDFDEWLARGSGSDSGRSLIDHALAAPPPGVKSFRVTTRARKKVLELKLWRSRFSVSARM
jgi:ubiquinone/menaquinone biosynthesis C-methylase UbiE